MELENKFDIEVIIAEEQQRPKLVIYTAQMNEAVVDLIHRCQNSPVDQGYQSLACDSGETVVFVKHTAILRIFTEEGHLVVISDKGRFALKKRLYEVEAQLDSRYFIKISQSEIVNFRRVEGVKTKLTGAFALVFEDGSQAFVSRRFLPEIKRQLGIK